MHCSCVRDNKEFSCICRVFAVAFERNWVNRGTQRICSSHYLFPRGILLAGKNTGVLMSWLGNFVIDRGFAWELLTFSSISTRAGCRNSEHWGSRSPTSFPGSLFWKRGCCSTSFPVLHRCVNQSREVFPNPQAYILQIYWQVNNFVSWLTHPRYFLTRAFRCSRFFSVNRTVLYIVFIILMSSVVK